MRRGGVRPRRALPDHAGGALSARRLRAPVAPLRLVAARTRAAPGRAPGHAARAHRADGQRAIQRGRVLLAARADRRAAGQRRASDGRPATPPARGRRRGLAAQRLRPAGGRAHAPRHGGRARAAAAARRRRRPGPDARRGRRAGGRRRRRRRGDRRDRPARADRRCPSARCSATRCLVLVPSRSPLRARSELEATGADPALLRASVRLRAALLAALGTLSGLMVGLALLALPAPGFTDPEPVAGDGLRVPVGESMRVRDAWSVSEARLLTDFPRVRWLSAALMVGDAGGCVGGGGMRSDGR